jgi:hypothetical protein
MAFGFPAYHEEHVRLPQPITQEWVAFACYRAGMRPPGWPIQEARGWTWRTGSSMSLASWGEDISITVTSETSILVRSQCILPTQCFDWGRNKKNVLALVIVLQHSMMEAMPR